MIEKINKVKRNHIQGRVNVSERILISEAIRDIAIKLGTYML